jgi:hypothetical protein
MVGGALSLAGLALVKIYRRWRADGLGKITEFRRAVQEIAYFASQSSQTQAFHEKSLYLCKYQIAMTKL